MIELDESGHVQCPKCGAVSGDNWSQCDDTPGGCPMPMSPYFNPEITTEERTKRLLDFIWRDYVGKFERKDNG